MISPDKDTDDGDLQQGLQELHDRALREHAPKACDRIELVELEGKRLRREHEADLVEVDSKPHNQYGDHHGKRRLREDDHTVDDEPHDRFRIDRLVHVTVDVDGVRLDLRENRAAERAHHEESRQQHEGAAELLTPRHLPFLARIVAPLRRRLFRLLPREELEVEDEIRRLAIVLHGGQW